MSARNGVRITKRFMPSKRQNWVFVQTLLDGSPLSFEDWYEQIRLLRECEEEKYSWVEDPLEKPRRFFERCWEEPMPTFEELRSEFRIPDRSQVVR